MGDSGDHVVERQTVVDAPPQALVDLLDDVPAWPRFDPEGVHAHRLTDGGGGRYRYWTLAGDTAVRVWRLGCRTDRADGRITFEAVPEDGGPPVSGHWWLRERGAGTLVRLRLTSAGGTDVATLDRAAGAQLDTLRRAYRHRTEATPTVVTTDDSVLVAGSPHRAYDYLYDVRSWPHRLPHVSRLTLTEQPRNVQFFEMDAVLPDGTRHTTRSVRLCFPTRLIVYKQLTPAALMEGQLGRWRCEPTPEGTRLTAQHTLILKPGSLATLGIAPGAPDARQRLRDLFSTNSRTSLRLAKSWVEQPTDAARPG
ncbi:SRPBCC family protein [Micromonospora cathayae]|uniref:SRPBCC family protein n=1 Tax=Micromonospora cathayae TaxID=3028804 RepID=A0ABY7ZKU8_9ACTN|nr:SRPBCC family protein [Micromonospora sp. HUAS 3]WDZ83575.1 SRPBCC family protein [Micromonospora sp. HUAS 3]